MISTSGLLRPPLAVTRGFTSSCTGIISDVLDTAGRVKVNRLPFPGSLSSEIFPPCCSTRRFVIASPNPVPSLVASAFPSICRNSLLVLSSDTYPCIGYRYTNLVAIFNASYVDPAVLRREFDRIAKQVVQNLLKTNSIGIHRPVRLQLLLDLDIFSHCQWTDCGEDFRQSIPDLKVFASQFELPGFDFREIQNVID